MSRRKQNRQTSTPRENVGWRKGVVLLIVLVVIMMLSLSAYTFSDLMLAQRHGLLVNGRRIQAHWFVQSGVELITTYLALDAASQEEMGGHFDNPLYFQGVVVLPDLDAKSRGGFSVLAPYVDPSGMGGGIRYGLEDESTRLNLNILLLADQMAEGAGRDLLMALPGMTEDVADAILDWMDEDEETREYGAEFDYYSSLDPPYEPRNAPPLTVEELLLVRGVYPELLFGVDTNRNAVVDPHETMTTGNSAYGGTTPMGVGMGAMGSDPTMTAGTPGLVERGWSAYLTLYSAERNTTVDGLPRINLNQDDLQTLNDELTEVFSAEWANFIVAYRLYGPGEDEGGGGEVTEVSASELELDLSQEAEHQIAQVIELIGADVVLPEEENRGGEQQEDPPTRMLRSPFTEDPLTMATYLTALVDNCTSVDAQTIPARINVNLAAQELILGIPGMTEEIAEAILNARATLVEDDEVSRDHETWLLTEGLVTLDEMRQLTPFICATGHVYRAQIVGYYQGGGPAARVEVIFDATGQEPAVLFWRDISHLGRGYALETLGIDMLDSM